MPQGVAQLMTSGAGPPVSGTMIEAHEPHQSRTSEWVAINLLLFDLATTTVPHLIVGFKGATVIEGNYLVFTNVVHGFWVESSADTVPLWIHAS